MLTPGPRWPRRDEYDRAMLQWTTTLQDPILRRGQLARDRFGIRRYGGAGLYVCLYRVDDVLVRCFCSNPPQEPPADIEQRYAAIERFCQAHANQITALIPIAYQPRGIQVGARLLPIVTMPFVQPATSLGRYVELHRRDAARMTALEAAWQRMIAEMEAAPMAHGDLDLTNVLVQEDGAAQPAAVKLRLIDYDNLWLPELAGRAQTEHGHEPFQHPAFLPPNARPYAADMDRFSALVMLLSLKALASRPALYDEWAADDSQQLLLAQADYRDPDRADGRLAHLASMPGMAPYVAELRACLHERRTPRALGEIERHAATATPLSAPDGSALLGSFGSAAPASLPLDQARPPLASFAAATHSAAATPYPTTLPNPSPIPSMPATPPTSPSPVASYPTAYAGSTARWTSAASLPRPAAGPRRGRAAAAVLALAAAAMLVTVVAVLVIPTLSQHGLPNVFLAATATPTNIPIPTDTPTPVPTATPTFPSWVYNPVSSWQASGGQRRYFDLPLHGIEMETLLNSPTLLEIGMVINTTGYDEPQDYWNPGSSSDQWLEQTYIPPGQAIDSWQTLLSAKRAEFFAQCQSGCTTSIGVWKPNPQGGAFQSVYSGS